MMSHRKRGQELLGRLGLTAQAPVEQPAEEPMESLIPEERLQRVETRVAHIEAALEGLQDSMYRETQRIDEALAELHRKTEPHAMSQALSADARRRGV
jgi:uncharacterized coiled-coil protein SlyX